MSQVNILAFYDTQQADNSSGNRYAEASQVKKNIWIFPFIVWSLIVQHLLLWNAKLRIPSHTLINCFDYQAAHGAGPGATYLC